MGEGLSTMGGDIKSFGESVIKRIDRIVKKKTFTFMGDPWTIQGLPLPFHTRTAGFHLGVRLMLQNISRQDPHKLQFEAQVLASDRGRYKHFMKIDVPRIFDDKFQITSRLAYDRDITLRYYGIGNQTTLDPTLARNNAPLYQNDRAGPSFSFLLLRRIGRNLRIGPTLGLRWTTVTFPPGGLLDQQRPIGVTGGRTHYFGLAVIDSTLDFEPYPSRGRWHELFLNYYAPFLGSQYEFFRGTYTFRKYHPLHRKLIFAYRILFESLIGRVPFFELGAVGGDRPTLGFGGDRYLRGYEQNNFIDRIRFVLGLEMRWDPIRFSLAKQAFHIGFVPFFDIGRVWDRVFPLEVAPLHASAGWGMRLVWNYRFVLRGDFALNADGTSVHINFGHSF